MIGWLVKILKARRTGVRAWVLAGLFFAVAFAVRLALTRSLDPVPFITYYPVVVAATLVGGWRQGALATGLSALAGWLFLVEPRFSLAIVDFDAALWIAGFVLVAGFLIVVVEGMARAVQELDDTARVNEDLFRELQHRVANNLQIVASTLEKAQRGIREPAALQAINHALNRIHSMAALHRQLYDAAGYSRGLEPILREVMAEAFRALPVDSRLEIRGGELSVGQMTAIALLVNEAAINAVKHVFRPGKGTLFEVSLVEIDPGRMQLTIRDDGPGIPDAAAGPDTRRFGLTVMRALASQLGGSLELNEGQGATLCVRFPRR